MSYTELKTSRVIFRLLHRGEGERLFAGDWPRKVDAVLVEMVQDPPIQNWEDRFETFVVELENNPDFKALTARAKTEGFLVCFGDLAESVSLAGRRNWGIIRAEFLIGMLSVLAGARLLGDDSQKQKERKVFIRGLSYDLYNY